MKFYFTVILFVFLSFGTIQDTEAISQAKLAELVKSYLGSKVVDKFWDTVTGKPDIRKLDQRLSDFEQKLANENITLAQEISALRKRISSNTTKEQYYELVKETTNNLIVRLVEVEETAKNNSAKLGDLESRINKLEEKRRITQRREYPEIKFSAPSEYIGLSPVVNFGNIWVEHNVTYNLFNFSINGMRIHTVFHAIGMRNCSCHLASYFYGINSNYLGQYYQPLIDYNGVFNTVNGKVSTGMDFNPLYDSTTFSDFTLFMPYNELHLSPGMHSLAFQVQVYDKATGNMIASSNLIPFKVSQY